jgi:hypothetical protein
MLYDLPTTCVGVVKKNPWKCQNVRDSLDSAKPSRYEVQQLPVDPGHYGRKGHLHWKSLSVCMGLKKSKKLR